MKLLGWLCFAASLAFGYISWTKLALAQSENQALRAALHNFETEKAAVETAESLRAAQDLERLRAEAKEVFELRNQVTQLRAGNKELEKLRAENSQLRTDIQSLRLPPQPSQSAAANVPSAEGAGKDHFPRENWAFAGYGSPESALVSAIWAMREGNPGTYLESLGPTEQLRMAQVWQDKSETEIAAKHQKDVSAISGMRILGREEVSPNEVLMNVFVEGVNRLEKVSMKRVGADWKFDGYIREPPKP